jgi:anthranilate phosphoribosyltransferase
LIVETLKILGKKKAIVVRGEDWLDEVTLTGKTLVYKLEDWKIEKFYIEPEDFWFKKVKLEEILEKDIDKKILIAKKIIAWENVWPYSDLVNLNVAVANYFFN